jgi:cell division protein FtsI (penicillin-binding protein 3)
MYDFYHSIGVGQRMHSGFPGESAGLLRKWENWRPIEQATMSFGYGLQLSLLQLARAYTVITHNGELLPVSFEKQQAAPKGEQIIKPATAKAVRNIMISVTEKGGTGTAGAVDGFDVGAKTGTARKLVNGRYVDNKHVGMFIGFAPAMNPRVIVAVSIDEPSANGYYGGIVAGPVFKSVMGGSLNILGVSPTKPLKEAAMVQAQAKP